MNPEISRRLAVALNTVPLELKQRINMVTLTEGVQTFDELPEEVRNYILDSEKVVEAKSLTLKYSPDQPRDENGRFAETDGGSTGFDTVTPPPVIGQPGTWQSKLIPPGQVDFVVKAKEDYIRAHGMPVREIDYLQIAADPVRGKAIADHYETLPSYDKAAEPAYEALRSEVKEQFDYMVNDMGIKVDVVEVDPYKNGLEMTQDLRENGHIAVLSTASTGGHPFFTNEENDMFRAVHDVFGHAGAGTNFDRNGEEASFVSHFQMFSPLAARALAVETRGQNSWLTYSGNNTFAEQKLTLLPEEMSVPYPNEGQQDVQALLKSWKFTGDDEAWNEDRFGVVNVSLGRYRYNQVAQKSVELKYSPDQPRDELGRFGETGGAGAGVPASTGVHITNANVQEMIWRPVMSKIDERNRRYGSFTTYGEVGDIENSSASQDMKSYVSEDIASRMSDIPPRDIASAAGLDSAALVLALTPAEEKYSDYADNEDALDFQIVSIDNAGNIGTDNASDVFDLSEYKDWTKEDVIAAINDDNDALEGDAPQYALQGTPEAEQMARTAAVSMMVGQWAQTSNDNSPVSLAIQQVAAKEFGIENHADWNDSYVRGQVADKIDKYETVYSSYLHAQYDSTQAFLKEQGITSITAYRGMKDLSDEQMAEIKSSSTQDAAFRPLTSWSLDESAAFKFAGSEYQGTLLENAAMFRANIPAENILSIPATGIGCLHESEVVAFGGQHNVDVVPVKSWYDNAIKNDKDGWGNDASS